jgi:hypothetical protein
VRVEGWNVEREPSDPVDATSEQLLLAHAIKWAQAKLNKALLNEIYNPAKSSRIQPTDSEGDRVSTMGN